VATIFSGLASKSMAQVSRFGPQNWWLRFGDLGLKITAIAFWFGPQNRWLRFGDLGLKITATASWFGPQKPSRLRFVSSVIKPMEGGWRGTRIEI
jgi:hypothetical protein